jgi:S1-C subfamily serine protease
MVIHLILMSHYKILVIFMISIITIPVGASLSYSQMPSYSSNSSLPPEYIVKKFMTMGGQLPINDSQLTGIQQGIPSNNNTNMNNTQLNSTTSVSSQSTTTTNNLLDFPKIYKSIVPSVVEVTAYNTSNHTIFKTGSGFIYNFNGMPSIITVSNLVAGKNDITVTLSDGSSYYSNLSGYDPLTNLAILSVNKIPQSKLAPSLQLGNSSNLEEGQQVIAIGNTLGLKNQITSGIVSGLDQPIPVLSQNSSQLLPKMPIGISDNLNLGNGYGGSPLLDTKGQVIGMNIGNYTTSSETTANNNTSASNSIPKNIGISFAVPSNSISKIVPSLLSKGYYEHPWFGVSGTDVNLDIAKALNLNESRGFLVIDVAPSSPAKKAGIVGGDNTTNINGRPITLGGDIILKIDNKDIQNIHDILAYIESKKNVGDNILVTVLRDGIIQFNTVKLGSNPTYLP